VSEPVTPTPQATDTLAPEAKPPYTEPGIAQAHLRNFLKAMYAVGEDAEAEYQRALRDLRHNPEAIVSEIAVAYGASRARDYPGRWGLIFAAGELRHPAALPFLVNIAETPLPPEPAEPAHGFSIVGEETILRTTAIEAIGHFVEERRELATAALLRALKQPSLSIRRAAVQVLKKAGASGELIERIRAELPPDFHFLLTLSTPRVEEVAQVPDPRRFLSERGRAATNSPPPALGGPHSREGEPPPEH
jgi:hypothetical protein